MFRKMGKKAKALGFVFASTVVTTASQAAITWDAANKEFTGDVDLGAYYSGVEIAVGVVGITLGIGLFFSMLKKAKG